MREAPREEGAAERGTRGSGDARPHGDAGDQDAAGTDVRGGRLGFLVPSGLSSDHGTGALRDLFLERSRWEWLFGVENRDLVFPIHRSYKFNPVVVQKGGATEAIRTVFMRRNPDDWERADEFAIPYTLAQIKQFSPKRRALLEIQSQRDLEILEKIYDNGVLVGDDGPDGWAIRYVREFDMTNDSSLFSSRPQWEAKGYRPDEYSRWLLGDWRPIEELWEEMGVDPSRSVPSAIDLEDWLFDDTAGRDAPPTRDKGRGPALTAPDAGGSVIDGRPADGERGGPSLTVAEVGGGAGNGRATDNERLVPSVTAVAVPPRGAQRARLVRGHRLKPGDVARTDWRPRCAQQPYDRLPIPLAALPPGVVLSRDGDAWMREEGVRGVALPLYQGIMIQPFVPSARGWLSGTGLRAKWDYRDLGHLQWNPQYLMAEEHADAGHEGLSRLKIGYREVARNTDARSFIGAVLPSFPAGHKVPILHIGARDLDAIASAIAVFNSVVFDWVVRQRLGAAALAWFVLAEATLPRVSHVSVLSPLIQRLNLFPRPFAAADTLRREEPGHAVEAGERLRLRTMVDAVACAAFDLDAADLRHVLHDCDQPTDVVGPRSPAAASLDPRGFWRVDRDKPPELRHTVLTFVAFHDLQAKIEAAGGDRERGVEAFLTQNDGEGWMLPETLRLADYGLGHDERARVHQPVASRLGPRFYDWQLAQSADESWRECHLHARNLLGAHGYALRVVDLIAQRKADGDDWRHLTYRPVHARLVRRRRLRERADRGPCARPAVRKRLVVAGG